MSDTPRTDAAEKHAYEFKDEYTPVCESKLVRQLERELTAAQAEIPRLKAGGGARDQRTTQFCGEALKLQEENARLQERVKRLEEAGDEVDQVLNWHTKHSPASKNWRKAKDTQ